MGPVLRAAPISRKADLNSDQRAGAVLIALEGEPRETRQQSQTDNIFLSSRTFSGSVSPSVNTDEYA